MKTRRVLIRMNGRHKPVTAITDRAKRYRANADGFRPGPPKRCGFCGSRKNVEVNHVSGDESDGEPDNLMWACRSCNTKIGYVMRAAGVGVLTRQYNPSGRKTSMAAYGAAIKVMRGDFPGDVAAAVRTIRSTPASVRSAYTARTWRTRRQLYGSSGRQTEMPF